MNMFDLCALGELIIDFTPAGITNTGIPMFACYPGGAPGNVAACISKLGKKTSYIGMVGKDQFGKFLTQTLEDIGVDVNGIITTSTYNTTLAFVHLDSSGDRSFSFYRKPSADIMLDKKDVNLEIIDNAKVFHFGSVSMTDSPARDATLYAAHYAKTKGKLVSYDPNLRQNLWTDLQEANDYICEGLKYANIVKLAEEELEFLTHTNDLIAGSLALIQQYDLKVILTTLGENGALCVTPSFHFFSPAFKVEVKDTNGAGDAFTGGFLYHLLSNGKNIDRLTQGELEQCVIFANATGALTTTGSGAIPSLPILATVEEFIKKHHRNMQSLLFNFE